ncbi:cytochrome c oxidase subunit 6A, mitochondrial [Sitophilus oryzae]|uniref:Cytochrome c oxidase subunit n=1 Tax=Sitophilus oryzae TaxID=7048 RepID=A0A6J2X4I7_SITOR|nr:cytochrome c oxidase subunit 6A, mitochondrial [Sitophilus oryzae]
MAAILQHAAKRFIQTSAQRSAQVEGPSAVSGIHEGGYKIWKNLSIFVAAPAIILCAVNCYLQHQSHHAERPEFIKYDYLAVRTKKFPWGDGNHSLFHNPKTNALPSGYEE